MPVAFSFAILAGILVIQPARPSNAPPEIDPARVARAIALTRTPAMAKIKNARVVPRWLAGRDVFWYRRDVTEGYDFQLVEAASGAKRAAFDRDALATALATATGKPVDRLRLPVTDIASGSGAGVTVDLNIAGQGYRCGVAEATTCQPAPAAPDPSLLVSPDKRRAVFVRDDNLWLKDLETGRERRLTEDGVRDAGWGMAPDHGNPRRIPSLRAGLPLPPYLVSWSPDSRRILAPRVDQRAVAPYPYIEDVPVDGSFRPKAYSIRLPLMGEQPARTDWFLFDAETGERRRVDYPVEKLSVDSPGWTFIQGWWTEDGRRYFQLVRGPDFRSGHLFQVDPATGAVRTVVDEPVTSGMGFNLFNAGGYAAQSIRIIGGGSEVIVYSARDGWGHLYRYDVATGTVKNQITKGPWVVRDIIRVDERRRQVYFVAAGREPGANPYHRHLYRVGLDGTDLTLLTPEPGDHMMIDPTNVGGGFDGTVSYHPFSPSGDYFVSDASAIDRPAVSTIRRSTDGKIVATVERADASALLAAGYRPPEELVVKASDGVSDLHGLVYRPSDYDPNRKYPVIDVQYGSPVVAITPRTFAAAATFPIDFFPPAATAELGFIVVVLDARGTPFRSKAFSDAKPGYLADMGLVDHVAFITEVARRDPAVDLTRVGISGVSFGGWTALRALLGYPDFFKVGIAGAAPGSFHTMYHAPALTALEGPPRYDGGTGLRPTATAVPANFAATDNVRQVDRMKGKLLMIVGEHDENVLPGSTLSFYHAAMKADKDVELIYVPNANHGGFYTGYTLRRVWAFWLRELVGATLPSGTVVPGMSP